MGYDTKAPPTRISKELDDYLKNLSKECGLPKVQVSRLLAKRLKDNELTVTKTNKKRVGFIFDFKI